MSFGNNTTSSNGTGLAIAEETAFKTLPATPVWRALEPNEYNDFGGEISTVARNPIKQDRQRRKGVVTDLDASAGFVMDFTQHTPYNPLTGFMFANWREKEKQAATAFTAGAVTVADRTNFVANIDVIAVIGAETALNKQPWVVAAAGAGAGNLTLIDVATFGATPVAETLLAGSECIKVGAHGGDFALTVTGSSATIASGTVDFTTLSLIPGEWVFVGADGAAAYTNAANNGWYRIKTVAAGLLTFDRIPDNAVTEAAPARLVIYYGDVLKNESDPANIVCKSYTIERRLTNTQFQYVVGCGANELELSIPTADKITASLDYMGADSLPETAQRGGTRLPLPDEDAFNTTSNVTRLRMINDETDAALYTFVSEATININNGITGLKAIGTLGAFDLNFGDFMVSGDVTAYFTNVAAVQAVRNNTAVSLDYTMVTRNQGWLIDIPYLTMSDGRPQVEKDEPVTIPLGIEGAAHPDFDHTMLIGYFPFLPDLAE